MQAFQTSSQASQTPNLASPAKKQTYSLNQTSKTHNQTFQPPKSASQTFICPSPLHPSKNHSSQLLPQTRPPRPQIRHLRPKIRPNGQQTENGNWRKLPYVESQVIGPSGAAAPLIILSPHTLTQGHRVPLTILRFCDYFQYIFSNFPSFVVLLTEGSGTTPELIKE